MTEKAPSDNRRAVNLARITAYTFIVGMFAFVAQPLSDLYGSGASAGHRTAATAVLAGIGLAYIRVMLAATRPPWRTALPWDLLVLTAFCGIAPWLLGPSWLTMGFVLPAAALAGVAWPYAPFAGIAALLGAGATGLLLGAGWKYTALYLLQDALTGIALAGIALLVAFTGELLRARAEAARLAVTEERLRFARDLHDVLGHNLSAISLKSELATRLAAAGPGGGAGAGPGGGRLRLELDEIHEIARQSLHDMRAVVKGYRAISLPREIQGVRSVLETAGIACEFEPPPGGLAAPLTSVLAWAVREAATNTLRHSSARVCRIQWSGAPGTLLLEIANDGAPVRRHTDEVGGSGLAGLAERLAAVGGRCSAGAERGWFRLRISVPWNGSAAAAAAEHDGRVGAAR